MKKSSVVIIILIITILLQGVYFIYRIRTMDHEIHLELSSQKDKINQIETELDDSLKAIAGSDSDVAKDAINNILINKFGPCWGITPGNCKE